MVTEYFSSLPADRFPNLAVAGGALAQTDPAERVDQLIEVLIEGLAPR